MEEGSSPLVIVAVFAIFAVVMGVVVVQKIKRRSAQWTGEVIDKQMDEFEQHNSRNRNNSGFSIGTNNNAALHRIYTLRIRDTSGKEFSWPVGEGLYQTINVGDTLQKQPGTETPTVIAKANVTTQSVADQQPVASQPTVQSQPFVQQPQNPEPPTTNPTAQPPTTPQN